MRSLLIFFLAASSLPVAGCNALTTAQIANVSCVEAEAGADLAVALTTDANAGGNATKAAARAQETASVVQKTIGDACPIIAGGVNALNAAASGGGGVAK